MGLLPATRFFMRTQKTVESGFFEQRHAEDLQDFVQGPFDPEFFLDDGHEHVDADGNPHLCLHSILTRTVEGFDPQMLFDPFEEQLNLPPPLVKPRDRQRGQGEVVGQEHKPAIVLGVVIHDATQRVGVQPR